MATQLRRNIEIRVRGTEQVVRARDATSEFVGQKRGVEETGGALDTMGRQGEVAGRRIMRWIGRTAVAAVLAFVVAMRNATRRASEFNDGMAQVATLLGVGRTQLREYERALLDMSARSGVALGDLTSSLYQVVSAGFEGRDALFVLENASRAAIAGATDMTTAVNGITGAIRGFGLEASAATDVADAMFVAVRRGRTTFGELSGSIGQVAALAESAGVELEQILAGTAALTLSGISTSEAMNQLSAVFIAAQRSGERFKAIGIDINRELAERGLAGTLRLVRERAEATDTTLVSLFGRVEGARATLALTGSQADAFARTLAEMENMAGETNKAFRTMQTETSNLWSRVKNQLSAAFMNFGQRVLPLVNSSLQAVLRSMAQFRPVHDRLVDSLRDIGAPAEDIAQIEVAGIRARAQRERARAMSELSKVRILHFNEFTREYRAFAATEVENFEHAISRRTNEMISAQRRIAEGGEELTREQRRHLEQVEHTRRREIDQLTTAHGLILEIQAAEKALADDVNEQVSSRAEVLRLLEDLNDAQPDPIADPAAKKRAEELAELFREIARAAETAELQTQGAQRAIRELFRAEDDLRQLRSEEAALRARFGSEVIDRRVAQLEREIVLSRQRIEREEGLRAAIERTAAAMSGQIGRMPGGLPSDLSADVGERRLRQANQALEAYLQTLNRVAVEEGRGAMTAEQAAEARRRAAEEYRQELSRVVQILVDLGMMTPELEASFAELFGRAAANADAARKSVESMGRALQNAAAAGRALFRLADTFGELSEQARRFGDGLFDAIDNMGRLADMAERSGEGGEGGSLATLFGTTAGALSGVMPIAGAIAGVASMISGLFGGGEEFRRLQEAIDDNVFALQRNTDALLDASQIGRDFTQEQVDAMLALIAQLRAGDTGVLRDIDRSDIGQALGGQFRDLFQQLFDAWWAEDWFGVLKDRGAAHAAIINAILTGDASALPQSIRHLLDGFDGLQNAVNDLNANLGGYSNTVQGAIARIRAEMQFAGLEGREAFDAFLDALANLDLSAEMKALLSAIRGMDLTTEEGQSAFAGIIEQMFRMGAASGLSASDLEALLSQLQGLAEGAGLDQDATRRIGVLRGITEYQGDVLLGLTREMLYALRLIAGAVSGSAPRLGLPMPPSLSGGSVSEVRVEALWSGDIQINGLWIQSVDDLIDEIARRVRDYPRVR